MLDGIKQLTNSLQMTVQTDFQVLSTAIKDFRRSYVGTLLKNASQATLASQMYEIRDLIDSMTGQAQPNCFSNILQQYKNNFMAIRLSITSGDLASILGKLEFWGTELSRFDVATKGQSPPDLNDLFFKSIFPLCTNLQKQGVMVDGVIVVPKAYTEGSRGYMQMAALIIPAYNQALTILPPGAVIRAGNNYVKTMYAKTPGVNALKQIAVLTGLFNYELTLGTEAGEISREEGQEMSACSELIKRLFYGFADPVLDGSEYAPNLLTQAIIEGDEGILRTFDEILFYGLAIAEKGSSPVYQAIRENLSVLRLATTPDLGGKLLDQSVRSKRDPNRESNVIVERLLELLGFILLLLSATYQ